MLVGRFLKVEIAYWMGLGGGEATITGGVASTLWSLH